METKEVRLYLTPEGADLICRALLLHEHALNLNRSPHLHDPQELFHISEIVEELTRQVTR